MRSETGIRSLADIGEWPRIEIGSHRVIRHAYENVLTACARLASFSTGEPTTPCHSRAMVVFEVGFGEVARPSDLRLILAGAPVWGAAWEASLTGVAGACRVAARHRLPDRSCRRA